MLPLSWSMKSRYMARRPHASAHHSIHVMRVPYHSSLYFSLNRLLRWIERKVARHVPGVRLFVTHRPSPNLRAVWHRLAMRTLRASGEGGWEGKEKISFTPELTVHDLLLVDGRAGA